MSPAGITKKSLPKGGFFYNSPTMWIMSPVGAGRIIPPNFKSGYELNLFALTNYSNLRLSAGFAFAALYALKLTVSKAMVNIDKATIIKKIK